MEQESEVGDCHRREGLRVDRKDGNAQRVQWACQTRLQQKWNTEKAGMSCMDVDEPQERQIH